MNKELVLKVIYAILFITLGILIDRLNFNYLDFNNSPNNKTNLSIIYFNDDMIELFNKRFENEYDEFLYCIEGIYNENDNGLYFSNIKENNIYYKNERKIIHKECNTLASIHSHPNGACYLSDADLNSFSTKLECIICGKNKINCFDKDNNRIKVIL